MCFFGLILIFVLFAVQLAICKIVNFIVDNLIEKFFQFFCFLGSAQRIHEHVIQLRPQILNHIFRENQFLAIFLRIRFQTQKILDLQILVNSLLDFLEVEVCVFFVHFLDGEG